MIDGVYGNWKNKSKIARNSEETKYFNRLYTPIERLPP